MSRFPNESVVGIAAAAATAAVPDAALALHLLNAWRRGISRSLRRARGRLPLHTLYLQPQGVLAWNTVDTRPAGVGTTSAFDNFDAWCRVNPNSEARLFVSGHLLHSLVADPALRLRDEDAVRNYARQQFVHYHGTHARQWPMAVWSSASYSGACAAHSIDLDALRATAASHDVHLHSIAPAWSAGLASLTRQVPSLAGPGPSAVALVEGSLVTWLTASAGTITSMQQRYLDAPRTGLLTELLDRLVEETGPFAHPATVVGWGLEDGAIPPALRANVVSPPGGRDAAACWMLDSMAHDT